MQCTPRVPYQYRHFKHAWSLEPLELPYDKSFIVLEARFNLFYSVRSNVPHRLEEETYKHRASGIPVPGKRDSLAPVCYSLPNLGGEGTRDNWMDD